MSIEVDVLIETYSVLKQYIPVKDQQEAADNLMSIMVDVLSDEDLKELSETDSKLRKAFKEYAEPEEYTDEDDSWE